MPLFEHRRNSLRFAVDSERQGFRKSPEESVFSNSHKAQYWLSC
jgi:hypothetical protein